MRHGLTLVEVLVALGLLGVLSGFAIPRLGFLRDRLLVQQQASALATGMSRARVEARRHQARAELAITLDSLRLQVLTPRGPRPVWFRAGPRSAGVSLSGPAGSLQFLPNGLPLGAANGRWRFQRGRAIRDLVLSRYGRIRHLP